VCVKQAQMCSPLQNKSKASPVKFDLLKLLEIRQNGWEFWGAWGTRPERGEITFAPSPCFLSSAKWWPQSKSSVLQPRCLWPPGCSGPTFAAPWEEEINYKGHFYIEHIRDVKWSLKVDRRRLGFLWKYLYRVETMFKKWCWLTQQKDNELDSSRTLLAHGTALEVM